MTCATPLSTTDANDWTVMLIFGMSACVLGCVGNCVLFAVVTWMKAERQKDKHVLQFVYNMSRRACGFGHSKKDEIGWLTESQVWTVVGIIVFLGAAIAFGTFAWRNGDSRGGPSSALPRAHNQVTVLELLPCAPSRGGENECGCRDGPFTDGLRKNARSTPPGWQGGWRSSWLGMNMRQKPEVGHIFVVPLDDGHHAIGQVIGIEPQALNSITCVFSLHRAKTPDQGVPSEIPEADTIAALFVTPDLLKRGRWRICARARVVFPKTRIPNEQYRSSGWVGAKIVGYGIVESFLNAYHGLRLWDDWHDPNYLDALLLPGAARPKDLKLKPPKEV